MSSPSNEGPLSTSSTVTATNEIPEPHDRTQSSDIILDWDGPQDSDNPRKSVHVTSFSGATHRPSNIQLLCLYAVGRPDATGQSPLSSPLSTSSPSSPQTWSFLQAFRSLPTWASVVTSSPPWCCRSSSWDTVSYILSLKEGLAFSISNRRYI